MKKVTLIALTALTALTVLTGCTNFTSPARKHELSDSKYWFDYDASRRGTLLLPKSAQGTYVVCSEPAPDVAMNLVNKLEGKLTAKDIEIADAKGEITISAIKLAERTQMVMFLRESLYRLCEQSMSNAYTPAESKEMYLKVVQTALEIVEKDKTQLKVEAAKAEEKAEKAKMVNKLLDNGLSQTQIENLLEK